MLYTKDEINEANERSIVDFFQKMGCKVEYTQGGREAHIRGYGGLYVHTAPDSNYNSYVLFSQSRDGRYLGGRGLVSCICNVFRKSYLDAVKMALDGKSPSSPNYDLVKNEYYKDKVTRQSPRIDSDQSGFKAPAAAENANKVFAYLTRRGISNELINDFIKKGLLYEDKQGNAVFLHKASGTVCGGEKHGTAAKSYTIGTAKFSDFTKGERIVFKLPTYVAEKLSEISSYNTSNSYKYVGYVYENEANIVCNSRDYTKLRQYVDSFQANISAEEKEYLDKAVHENLRSFQGVLPGTKGTYFSYDIGRPTQAFVFESAIDLMSFIELHPDISDSVFVSIAGLKPSIVRELECMYDKVILCTDNPEIDKASADFLPQFLSSPGIYFGTRELKENTANNVKDYNDLLMYTLKKNNQIQTISETVQNLQQKAEGMIRRLKDEIQAEPIQREEWENSDTYR